MSESVKNLPDTKQTRSRKYLASDFCQHGSSSGHSGMNKPENRRYGAKNLTNRKTSNLEKLDRTSDRMSDRISDRGCQAKETRQCIVYVCGVLRN